MKVKVFTLAILALSACQREHEPNDPVNPLAAADKKAAVYLSLAGESKDAHGFVHSKCDGLLFTALHVVGGGQADIMQAQGKPGQWFRHAEHDCYDLEQAGQPGSKSDISQDMILGLLWWAWETGNLNVVEDLIAYGVEHNWVMGRGDPFRTVLRPNMIWLLYSVKNALAGTDDVPTVPKEEEALGLADFGDHLEVLRLLLLAHVAGAASEAEMNIFKAHAERQPRNALFQAAYHLYTDGDQSAAGAVLDDPALFPADRLPAVSDRCEEYLWQRDESDNWAPCPASVKPHSGTDLLFALKVAGNKLKKGD